MVLPASALDGAPAPAEGDFIERLRLILRLASGGVLVLIDKARPERLGPMVRALVASEPAIEVHVDARRLVLAEQGSAIVLVPDPAQAGWLNMERPILAEKSLRVLLFSDSASAGELARRAPDFFHWTSHWVECPAGSWGPAVRTIQAADAAEGVLGIAWTEGDFDEAFDAALPGRPLARISAALPYDEIVDAIRKAGSAEGAGEEWIAFSDIDGLFRLRRVRWALAETGRTRRAALLSPTIAAPGFVKLGGVPLSLAQACSRLELAGARCPGRLAALLNLEPDAIQIAATLLEGGLNQAAIEAALLAEEDGGAVIARLGWERGVSPGEGSPLLLREVGWAEFGAVGVLPGESAVREGHWVAASDEARQAGDFNVAVRWARRALAADGDRKLALDVLGRALSRQGSFTEAEERLREAVGLYEGAPDAASSLDHASGLRGLATVLARQGDLAGARERLERSLQIAAKELGTEEHPQVTGLLHELANVLAEQGDLAGAREHLERSLQIAAKVFGTEEHPGAAASLHELARVLAAQGDLAGARERLERSLRIWAKVFGTEEHPNVAASLQGLALILVAEGELAGARERLEQALRIYDRIYGTRDNYPTALTEWALAKLLLNQQEHEVNQEESDRGLELLRHAHAIFLAQLGPDHPTTKEAADLLSRL